MRGNAGRALFLLTVACLFVWLFYTLRPDRPTTVQAPPAGPAARPGGAAPAEPWTQEDRAMWRETVDRRLRP